MKDKKELKCACCGANIRQDEKACSYCGGSNKHYVEEKPKDVVLPTDEFGSGEIGGDFIFGNIFNIPTANVFHASKRKRKK